MHRIGSGIVLVAFVGLMAGCSSPKSPDVAENPAPPSSAVNVPNPSVNAPNPAPNESKPEIPVKPNSNPTTISPNSERDRAIRIHNEPSKIKALKDSLPVIPPAQRKIPDTKGQGGWGPTTFSPRQLANNADKTLNNLTNAFADIRVHIVVPQGAGDVKLEAKIGAPTKYNVQYTVFADGHPSNYAAIANGKNRALVRASVGKNQKKITRLMSVSTRVPVSGANLASLWPSNMPQFVLNRYVTGSNSYGGLVNALISGVGKYQVYAEQRTLTYQGKIITDYRIVAQRSKANAAKLGYSQIEIVLDGERFLPLTLRTRFSPLKGAPTELDWSSRWVPDHFTSADFQIPAQASGNPTS